MVTSANFNGHKDYQLLSQPSSTPPVKMVSLNRAQMVKYTSLITLTVQNAALNITMRMARTQSELFITSTAVIISEVLKIITCIVMITSDEGE